VGRHVRRRGESDAIHLALTQGPRGQLGRHSLDRDHCSKGYQFTADVTVAEAADTAKQAAGQVSALESPADEAVPKAPKNWRKAAVVGASAALLTVVCFASWRHFGGMTPPRSHKIMLAVLPFENLTGDPNKEYLGDGLTEETISHLL
jgi:hypothetical protein